MNTQELLGEIAVQMFDLTARLKRLERLVADLYVWQASVYEQQELDTEFANMNGSKETE